MKKKRFMKRRGICLLLILMLLCWGAASADQTGTVRGGWLILRDAPSTDGRVISSYPTGTVVTITGSSGSWYAVTTPDGLKGYMLSSFLKVSGEGSAIPVSAGGTPAYVTSRNGLNVRLRSGAGSNYSVLATYAPGTECLVLESGSTWSKVKIGNYTGYMMTRYVTTTAPQPQPTVSPESGTGSGTDVWVYSTNGQGVNLRSGAGKSFSSIGFYSVGTHATLILSGSVWSYVEINGKYGYMMSRYLSSVKPKDAAEPQTGGSFVISSNGRNVNLRVGPGEQFSIVRSFAVGTPVTVISRGTVWDYVQIGGYSGYMMRAYIYEGDPIPTPPAGTT